MNSGSEKFVVYKSSAGSGKTFTLVKEYLLIILKNPETYRHILAITFTNKAANEMKERVIRYLKALADPVSSPDAVVEKYLLPELVSQTGLSSSELNRRASIAIKSVMHQYADFAVSTIDSFFHRVVRTFAHDLSIPLSFEVVLEEKDTLAEVVSNLLDRVGEDEDLTKILVMFIQSKSEEEKSWDIEKDLVDFSGVLIKESSIPFLEKMGSVDQHAIESARNAIWKYIRDFENELTARAGSLINLVESHGIDDSAMAGASQGLMPWLRKFQSKNYERIKAPAKVFNAAEKDEWSSSKAGKDQKATIRDIAGSIREYYMLIEGLIEEKGTTYLTFKAISGYLYPMAVLGALMDELQEYKKENNVLLISEFNRRIHSVVRDQPVPFIYERLGEKYWHFMVDEFQDTSVLQWLNLLPLVENSLAEGKLNLVVGDGKQAIYRFRSGDVKQFEKLPRLLNPPSDALQKAREASLVRNFGLKVLDQNFRSKEAVVEFNNRFFAKVRQWLSPDFQPVYMDVVQKVRTDQQGYVEIEFVERSNGKKAYQGVVMEKVLKTVEHLLSIGRKQKEIAILCRDNNNASRIAAMLLSNGKQVISAESLILSYSPEVNFLVAWMQYLVNPSDEISCTHILHYLHKSMHITREVLEDYIFNPEKPEKWSRPEEYEVYVRERFKSIVKGVFPDFRLDDLNRMDLFHLVGTLTSYFIVDAQSNPYLQFFKDQVLEITRKDHQSIPDFLVWWEEKGKKKSIVTPEGLDAIRVMTIHKAKGLEFPVVIYPFADEKVRLTLSSAWVAIREESVGRYLPIAYIDVLKSLEGTDYGDVYTEEYENSRLDLLNVLYVALTRARDQLYIFTEAISSNVTDANSIPKILKRFLMEEAEWQEDRMVYSYGQPDQAGTGVEEKTTPTESLSDRPVNFTDWKKRILIRKSAPESWDVDEPDKSFAYGNKIHHLLSDIKYPEDRHQAIQKATLEGLIPRSEVPHVMKLIDDLLTSPSTSWMFDRAWTVKNESEIIHREGKIYRPDRLMLKNNEMVVVDFKTGRRSDYHLKQVKQYAGLMEEMGYRVVKALIVYLGDAVSVVEASA